MVAQFLTFRRGWKCNAKWNKRDLDSASTELSQENANILKRQEANAQVLADLLLQNCSVAIQDVFLEETIPLPQSVLQSYSSVASSMQANPTIVPSGVRKPATATVGSAVPVMTTAAGSQSTGGGGNKNAGMQTNANPVTGSPLKILLWLIGLLVL